MKSVGFKRLSILLGSIASFIWFFYVGSAEQLDTTGVWIVFGISIIIVFFIPMIFIYSIRWVVRGFIIDKEKRQNK